MYGMVNKGVHDLIVAKGGKELWERIRGRAGCPFSAFQRLEAYDDQITYSLVQATSQELKISPAEVLESFGEFWIDFTGQEGYGSLLALFGADFKQSLMNLNKLHERMEAMLPSLRPPRFEFEELESNKYRLFYFSEREGLAPMVVGLLKGLAKKHHRSITVDFSPKKAKSEGDLFEIVIQAENC